MYGVAYVYLFSFLGSIFDVINIMFYILAENLAPYKLVDKE